MDGGEMDRAGLGKDSRDKGTSGTGELKVGTRTAVNG